MSRFKMVSFQFDDGLRGVWEKGASYLNKQPGKPCGTIALVTNWQKGLTTSSSPLLTWDHVKQLKDMGWDMQCHTASHPRLTELTDEEIHKEYQRVNEEFVYRGWDIPNQAYIPGRVVDDRVEQIVRQYREWIINLHTNTEILPDLDKEGINYASRRGDTQDDVKQAYLKQTVDELEEGIYDWVIFRGHDIRDAPTTYQYCYYTHYFEELVDYIVEKGIRIVTIEQGLRLQKAWKSTGI